MFFFRFPGQFWGYKGRFRKSHWVSGGSRGSLGRFKVLRSVTGFAGAFKEVPAQESRNFYCNLLYLGIQKKYTNIAQPWSSLLKLKEMEAEVLGNPEIFNLLLGLMGQIFSLPCPYCCASESKLSRECML